MRIAIFLLLYSLAAAPVYAARVAGIVVDASGAPVGGATLAAGSVSATTADDGTFTLLMSVVSIGSLIGEIQHETKRAVEVVESGAERTDAGAQTVEQARESFVAIHDAETYAGARPALAEAAE